MKTADTDEKIDSVQQGLIGVLIQSTDGTFELIPAKTGCLSAVIIYFVGKTDTK